MNDKDKEAFEKWYHNYLNCYHPSLNQVVVQADFHMEEAWQAALEYERKRSQILVDALDFIEQNYETNNEGTVALYRYWKGEA